MVQINRLFSLVFLIFIGSMSCALGGDSKQEANWDMMIWDRFWERSTLPDLRGEGVSSFDKTFSGETLVCTPNDDEFKCLACNAFFEANGEPDYGQVLVSYVVFNRAEMNYRKKNSVCGVIWDAYQFSWTNGTGGYKRYNLNYAAQQAWENVQRNVDVAIKAWEPEQRNGFEACITHYHANYLNPYPNWATEDQNLYFAQQEQVHLFYGDYRLRKLGRNCSP